MTLHELLNRIELFDGIDQNDMQEIENICQRVIFQPNEVVAKQGEVGAEFYIIEAGFVDIQIYSPRDEHLKSIVRLGPGQIVGEMALVDNGPRSATITAISSPTVLYKISNHEFYLLCDKKQRIGYLVMKNIASDLSFKLRHQNLQNY